MKARFPADIALAFLLTTVVAVRAQPPNDTCERATIVGPDPLPFTDIVDTTDATRTPGDPTSCNAGGHTVWYRVTPPATGRLCARTCGSDYDTVLVRVDDTRLLGTDCNNDFCCPIDACCGVGTCCDRDTCCIGTNYLWRLVGARSRDHPAKFT